jgi:hypothetical protein
MLVYCIATKQSSFLNKKFTVMQKQSNTLLAPLGKHQFAGLTTIVNETLAAEYKVSSPKVFTSAELWSIQRQKRAVDQRRFIA